MTMSKKLKFKFRNKRRQTRGLCDTQHILVREKDSIFGIDAPLGCFETSVSSLISTTTSPDTPVGHYSGVADTGGRGNLYDHRGSLFGAPSHSAQTGFQTASTMTAVDNYYANAIGSNLTTVSEKVPIYYNCSQANMAPTSTPTETDNWSDRARHNSAFQRRFSRRNFINFSTKEKIEELDDEEIFSGAKTFDSDDVTMISESSSSSASSTSSAEDAATTVALPKHVSFLENLSTSETPLETRPRIQITLMRAKAASVSNLATTNELAGQESKLFATSTESILSESQNINTTQCPDSSVKRSGYLKKIKTLFRPKSVKSMSNLMNFSNEQLSKSPDEDQSNQTRRHSSSFSSEDSHEACSSKPTFFLGENSKEIKEEATSSVPRNESRPKFKSSSNKKRASDRGIEEPGSQDGAVLLNRIDAGAPLSRSYSLIRPQTTDSVTVNFSRMPSLRKRRCHPKLIHHFTTALPTEVTQEAQAIKEATHIQPLKGGEAVVTDVLSSKLVLFDSKGFPKVTFAVESGSEPWATCTTPEGALAVTLRRQGCVSLWSTTGEPIKEFGLSDLTSPTGIQCDHMGRFLVADEEANTVFVFNKHGKYLSELSGPELLKENHDPSVQYHIESPSLGGNFFNHPRYICITREGDYVISDSANHCVKIFDQALNFKSQFGSFGKHDGQFKFPYGVAVDELGNLYVADHCNNRVSMFAKDGQFLEHILTSQDGITRPASIAISTFGLYVTHGDLRSSKISLYQLHLANDNSKD